MQNRIAVAVAVLLFVFSSAAHAEDAEFNKTLWQTRVALPHVIAEHQAMTQTMLWCVEESKKAAPNNTPCQEFKQNGLKAEKKTLSAIRSCQMLVTALKLRSDSPESALHLSVLDAQLKVLQSLPTPMSDAERETTKQ